MKEPILIEIAEKLNKSPAQVSLRWGLQSGHSVLPKSVNESRIKENLSLFDWFIPPELFSKLSEIHQVCMLHNNAIHRLARLQPYIYFKDKLTCPLISLSLVCDTAKAPPRGICNPRDSQSLQKPPRTLGW